MKMAARHHRADAIADESAAIQHVLRQAESVAATDSTVLLLGETGTGKELFATYIHACSGRRAREMISLNAAAIPATLIESELFGRKRAPTPTRSRSRSDGSSWRTARPFSSTRSATCPWMCR